MRPENLKTKIFLDSGDPSETAEIIRLLGFLDGQTTNPSLIAKNPDAVGKKFSKKEILEFYKKTVGEISRLIPQGSVSVEVYADGSTSAEEMFKQGQEFYGWIENAHIKYPTTSAGLKAAELSVKQGMRVNMTLVFSQEQAAAVYAATAAAASEFVLNQRFKQVFVSPFIGRLDDVGENGMDVIKHIIKMYKKGNHHVEVLTASVRSVEHLTQAAALGSDIITAPFTVLKQWAEQGMPVANSKFQIPNSKLKPIPYKEIELNLPWEDYDIYHQLTEKGLAKFAEDWNNLIA